jgi:DNA-binding CsgD family transcriptional regulator
LACETWPQVVRDIGIVTGGWGGNLFGVAGGRAVFNLAGGVPDDTITEFQGRGGADGDTNPRVKAAARAPSGWPLTESDFISRDERSRHVLYQEFFIPRETAFVLGSRLSLGEVEVYISTERTERQGPATAAQRGLFKALFPPLSAALRAHSRLDARSVELALSALDKLDMAVVACDLSGRMIALSASAEALLADGAMIVCRRGRLAAVTLESDQRLQRALAEQCALVADARTAADPVVLTSVDGRQSIVADVLRIPAGRQVMCGSVMVVFGAPRRRERNLLSKLGLTPAETEVARWLADGLSVSEIAERRGSGLETVRTHTKAVYAKLGVRRRLELASKLRGLI